jgi:CDP-diacylglycerol--serine O-phosphatidyltransferase
MLRLALHPANAVTAVGLAAAVWAITLAVHGDPLAALAVLTAAGLADLMDGFVARRTRRDEAQRRFGVALDSLADVVAFLALPAVILAAAGPVGPGRTALLVLYAAAGLTRLAAFDAAAYERVQAGAADEPATHYTGLPVTYAALVLPVAGLLSVPLPGGLAAWLTPALALLAVAFVTPVPVPKPTPRTYPVFFAVALAVGAGLVVAR